MMNIFVVIHESNLSEEHKLLANLHYREKRCTYEEVAEFLPIPERTYYRKKKEISQYICKKWQESEESSGYTEI